jgi:hypothetical protein
MDSGIRSRTSRAGRSYSFARGLPSNQRMVASGPALADLFLRGVHGVVLEELRSAPEELTREVARLVGTGLGDDAVEHWNVCPRELTWDESVGPFPPSEPQHLAGVLHRTQWAARSDGGLSEGTVTVLEVLSPEHNWLRTLAVWYRWDDSRAGNLLPTDEFKLRFEPL